MDALTRAERSWQRDKELIKKKQGERKAGGERKEKVANEKAGKTKKASREIGRWKGRK